MPFWCYCSWEFFKYAFQLFCCFCCCVEYTVQQPRKPIDRLVPTLAQGKRLWMAFNESELCVWIYAYVDTSRGNGLNEVFGKL